MRSLRTQLAVLVVLVTLVGTVTVGLFAYLATAARLDAELERSILAVAEAQRGRGGDGDRDGRPEPRAGRGEDAWVQYLGADGTILASPSGVVLPVGDADRAVAAGASPGVWQDVVVSDEPVRMLTVPFADGRAATQIARSAAENQRVLESLRWLILGAIAVVVALSGVAGWLLARQLTRRLTDLTAVAEDVAATGRLDLPVPAAGQDEAGRLGAAFASMLAALRSSKESQQRLVQDAGHELRTPLTSLRANLGVLRRHDDLAPADRSRVIDDLEAEGRELTDLVNELVALASDRASTEPVDDVALGPLAQRVADRARRRYGCDVVVTADDSVVRGRSAQLERAISNLVDNAAKFGGASGPVTVTVAAGQVAVDDVGPGIAAVDLPHVFDRFYRATSARSMPGFRPGAVDRGRRRRRARWHGAGREPADRRYPGGADPAPGGAGRLTSHRTLTVHQTGSHGGCACSWRKGSRRGERRSAGRVGVRAGADRPVPRGRPIAARRGSR